MRNFKNCHLGLRSSGKLGMVWGVLWHWEFTSSPEFENHWTRKRVFSKDCGIEVLFRGKTNCAQMHKTGGL